jgi:hypothetical protein
MMKKEQLPILRPGDELLEISMGFIAHGNLADFDAIRKFIESRKSVRLVIGTMSKQRLWLVKDKEFEVLKELEKRNASLEVKRK